MATNYTPHGSGATKTLTAARLNAPLQELDDTLEDVGDGTDALAAPSLVSFENSLHTHANAAGGGTIEGTALAFTGADDTDIVTADGANGVYMGSPLILPTSFRQGLPISKLSNTQALVGIGSVMVGSVMVNKTTQTALDINIGADWVRGKSALYWNSLQHIYIDDAGNVKFSDLTPNRSAPSTSNLICEMRINQPTWTGGVGLGLNEYTITYDDGGGGDPAGAANIAAGMLVGVYTDTGQSLGRGKGTTQNAGEKKYLSFAQVVSIDTANNSLVVVANHNIALNNNDVLMVIEDGPVIYRYEEGKWQRWLGAIYYSSTALETRYSDQNNYVFNEVADLTTISTAMETLWSLSLLTQGGDVLAHAHGDVANSAVTGYAWIGVSVDRLDASPVSGNGYFFHSSPDTATANRRQKFSFTRLFHNLPPGTHTFSLQMDTDNVANTTTFDVADEHPQFWVKEAPTNGCGY